MIAPKNLLGNLIIMITVLVAVVLPLISRVFGFAAKVT